MSKRIKGLQTGNVNDIEEIFDCETSNSELLEKCIIDGKKIINEKYEMRK